MILENVQHNDMKDILIPKISVDEYESIVGDNSDVITVAFQIKSKRAAEDLATWFNRGYDWILASKPSDGEISPNKFLVFVEFYRRTSAPQKIVKLIKDLKPLCGLESDKWRVLIKDEEYMADPQEIGKHIITSPSEYRKKIKSEEEKEEDKEIANQLNEYRHRAGLYTVPLWNANDQEIQKIKKIAGL